MNRAPTTYYLVVEHPDFGDPETGDNGVTALGKFYTEDDKTLWMVYEGHPKGHCIIEGSCQPAFIIETPVPSPVQQQRQKRKEQDSTNYLSSLNVTSGNDTEGECWERQHLEQFKRLKQLSKGCEPLIHSVLASRLRRSTTKQFHL